MKKKMTYDVVVIGSGPGGYSAAIRAGQYGLKTAIIEKDPKLGGTCLHVGCIPTKAFLHSADVWERFLHPEEDGIHCDNPRLDFPPGQRSQEQDRRQACQGRRVPDEEEQGRLDQRLRHAGGSGQNRSYSDSGTQILEAKNIVLATGSEARMLPGLQPDAERILTNIEILNLREVPKSLAILGAGAVGVEFASCFHRFGTKVSRVRDAAAHRAGGGRRSFQRTGARVQEERHPRGDRRESRERSEDGHGVSFTVTLANGKQKTSTPRCCWSRSAASRIRRISDSKARRELDRGFIKVDPFQRTGEPNVYAIGDIVAGTPQLAHVATAEGMVAIGHIAGKPVTPINRNRIPGATYTEPGIGSVGLTEAQARAQGHKVKIGKFPFAANSKASILGMHDGFVKIVADETYGEILGVHIIGPEAFELISEGVLAMESEATVETLMHTIHAHPTLYEAMGEAFNAVYGLAINA